MERTGVQKLARVLKILVTITFVCNLLVLPLVPILSAASSCGFPLPELLHGMGTGGASSGPTYAPGTMLYLVLVSGWGDLSAYTLVLALFLLFCGACTAAILWQGRKVLSTILRGTPFCVENAVCLQRSALLCFLISGAALVRVIWRICYAQSITPLLSYNMLFVPLFFLAGLLCLVISALFRQAAEMKAENELTI